MTKSSSTRSVAPEVTRSNTPATGRSRSSTIPPAPSRRPPDPTRYAQSHLGLDRQPSAENGHPHRTRPHPRRWISSALPYPFFTGWKTRLAIEGLRMLETNCADGVWTMQLSSLERETNLWPVLAQTHSIAPQPNADIRLQSSIIRKRRGRFFCSTIENICWILSPARSSIFAPNAPRSRSWRAAVNRLGSTENRSSRYRLSDPASSTAAG